MEAWVHLSTISSYSPVGQTLENLCTSLLLTSKALSVLCGVYLYTSCYPRSPRAARLDGNNLLLWTDRGQPDPPYVEQSLHMGQKSRILESRHLCFRKN